VGEWATWEINRKEKGRSAEKEGQQGAGGPEQVEESYRGWLYVPPKRLFISQDLRGATSQKTALFNIYRIPVSAAVIY
jgi:hypothetical protein